MFCPKGGSKKWFPKKNGTPAATRPSERPTSAVVLHSWPPKVHNAPTAALAVPGIFRFDPRGWPQRFTKGVPMFFFGWGSKDWVLILVIYRRPTTSYQNPSNPFKNVFFSGGVEKYWHIPNIKKLFDHCLSLSSGCNIFPTYYKENGYTSRSACAPNHSANQKV